MSGLLLGVDGGNTKTAAVVVEPDGTVLGAGGAGCGDIHNAHSPEPALVEIVQAASAALDAAGATPGDLGAAAFSLAGADWPEDFERLRRELTSRLRLREEPEIVRGRAERGVLVRAGAALGREGALRVTVGTQAENGRFLEALAALL